jgi:predicted RNA binding protein YcfA (HicA-like mRNA interferase family)
VPPFGPIKRADLIRYLQKAGYTGPLSGGQHGVMIKGAHRLTIPNPHGGDIGRSLLSRVLKQANISRDAWEAL